jgi:hypothetical protein
VPRTPRSRTIVLLAAAVLFLTAPAVVARYYYVELGRGLFPSDADSIGIPIFGFTILLLVTAPITWGFVWLCVRRYPGGVSLAAWNPLRPLWALGWTIVIVGAIAMFLVLTPWKDVAYHPLLIVHATMDILFMLTLRSAIVAQEISVTARN